MLKSKFGLITLLCFSVRMNVHFHIFLFGDHEEDDVGFGEELLKTFQKGIHGIKVGYGSFMNDHILYQSKVPVDQVIYRAFEDLKRRFGPSDLFTEDNNQSEFLDTKALHSFQLLLCNRCLTYDCLIHGVNATEMEVRRRRGITSVEPCGPHCFRHLTKEMEEVKRRCISPPDAKTINAIISIKTENINWTSQQEIMSSSANYFTLQLYAYFFGIAPISPKADVSPNSPPKKKK
ncbi:hypothetical protein X798_04721 [Onchocerca flexuosa]|uniref:EZH1/2 MCSS domain-containing protein n=1 Tax=Onchocerca flexuosa TaxID=387005 RepID=A0A238BSN0_9BILA|nr:hypothetical protein X798_04721 [Onchocerca flexuosa]